MSDIDRGIRISSQGHIGIVELARGPHNFFDDEMIAAIAEGCEALEADPTCRVIVLCAEGKSFCAGANFASPSNVTQARSPRQVNPIYNEALRLLPAPSPSSVPCKARPLGAAWVWPWWVISAWAAPKRASRPTSTAWAFTPALA